MCESLCKSLCKVLFLGFPNNQQIYLVMRICPHSAPVMKQVHEQKEFPVCMVCQRFVSWHEKERATSTDDFHPSFAKHASAFQQKTKMSKKMLYTPGCPATSSKKKRQTNPLITRKEVRRVTSTASHQRLLPHRPPDFFDFGRHDRPDGKTQDSGPVAKLRTFGSCGNVRGELLQLPPSSQDASTHELSQ